MQRLVLESTLYFSYSQFYVYDNAVYNPEIILEWTEAHSKQGFVKTVLSAAFGALTSYGKALLRMFEGNFKKYRPYQRVIAVPFYAPSGQILVEGPEEHMLMRGIRFEPGHYLLFVAQLITELKQKPSIMIDLFLYRAAIPLQHSQILVKDEALDPSDQILCLRIPICSV